ncbi:MAG: acyl-CoA thioester hydrolase [Gaiellales bacterium]|nr:acyl-CoA thioester hydrolase [Gaiellales bacterium]
MDGFGHVNNAVYLTYLEEARDEMYTGLLGDIVHSMVLRHTSVDFRSGLVQDDDQIDVSVEVVRIGSSSVTTRETITALSDGRIAAVAESVMVHCDEARSAAAPFGDDARALLEGVLSQQ